MIPEIQDIERIDRMSEKNFLSQETLNKAYDDAVHPVLSESGKLLARIPRAINAALSPLDIWILKRENNIERTKVMLQDNLKNVEPEKIISPDPYVAVPAIQAISYSMDSDELRKMYANLLSKAIYSDTKNTVHPAFVEIIKNLSPSDIQVFEHIMTSPYQEIGCYELRLYQVSSSSYHVTHPYLTEIETLLPNQIATAIDNLSRNNLVKPHDFQYDDDSMYQSIRETAYYKAVIQSYASLDSQELRPYKMSIKSTSFGKEFYKVCSVPIM